MAQNSVDQTTPLRRLRLARGLSLDDVARGAGIHNSHLSRIERGGDASKQTARRIAKFFDGAITVVEILCPEYFDGEGSPRGAGATRATPAGRKRPPASRTRDGR